ncbi:hypothetical protein L7F22_008338 [Adiantum nelumboides]|nr:hypothetical protein [Adiantum nelumboides]
MPSGKTVIGSEANVATSSSSLPEERLAQIETDGVVDSWEESKWVRHLGRLQRKGKFEDALSAPSSTVKMSGHEEHMGHHEEGAFPQEGNWQRLESLMEQLLQVSVVNAQNAQALFKDKGKEPAGSSGGGGDMGTFKPIKPTLFSGQRDSLVIDKWIRDTESFFRNSKMDERNWPSVVSHFLEGDAYNWFLVEERNDPYLSWRTLKTNLRSYFVPKNEDNRVLDDWRALAQGETKLQEYVGKYRQMMLRTDHLDWEKVRLHGFLYGLKEWARREIEKQNPTTYVEALEMAERLADADARRKNTSNAKPAASTPNTNTANRSQATPGASRNEQTGSAGYVPNRNFGNYRGGGPAFPTASNRSYSVNQGGSASSGRSIGWRPCKHCGGEHLDYRCPKMNSQSRVNAAWANEAPQERGAPSNVQITEITDHEAESSNSREQSQGPVRMGAIRASLHTLTARVKAVPSMYVQARINGQCQNAMIDSGASHNFISPQCARRLGIRTSKLGGGRSISVGFVQGEDSDTSMAFDVMVQIGEWRAKMDFIVVPMDSYDMMLGLIWFDNYVMSLYGKGVNQVMLDMNGRGVAVPIIRSNEVIKATKPSAEVKPKANPPPYIPPQVRGQASKLQAAKMTPQPMHATKGKARWDDLVPDSLWMSPKQTERAIRQGAQVHCCVMKVQVQNSEEDVISSDEILDQIGNASKTDPGVLRMMQNWRQGKTAVGLFDLRDGLWYAHDRIYVPDEPSLKAKLLWETHDCKIAGHGGQKRSFEKLSRHFYWPKMQEDVVEYVRTCPTCQLVKAQRIRPAGLLMSMPTPSRPWDVISMDFIVDLPESHGFTMIFVVVDYFSKQAHFIPAKPPLTAYQTARLFFKNVFKSHGLPLAIVSDRDGRFLSDMWQELFKLLGTQLRFSSAYHPQTDGQTERINQGIEDYIRSYVQADQKDWADFLEVLEFQYNSSVHTGTGYAPFELATGKEVITPMALASGAIHAQDLDAEEFLANWQKRMEVARRHLVTYKEKYVAKANEKARAEFFQAGDLVLVSSQNINLPANLTPKFNHRYYGPYRIVRDFNNVSYQLELPTNVKIHNVFHVSLLKRFHVDKKFGRHVPLLDKGVNPFEPEIILKHRFVRKYPEFYVKWRGRPMSDCTWVPEDRVIAMDKQLLLRYYNMPELRHMPRI